MDLRQVKCFLKVADEHNITKAASLLNMSQPPLSRKIKQMENELGIQLFIRDKHTLQLTDSGKILYRRGREMVRLMEKTEEELEEIRTGNSGTISVAAVQSLGTTWMPGVIKKYNKNYPKIGFNVYIGNSDEIQKRLDSGEYDVGIMREPFDFNHQDYEYIELEREYWCVLMQKSDPLSQYDILTVKDLAPQKLLLPMRTGISRKLRNWLKINDMDTQIFCSYSELMTAVVLVKEGLGIAIVTNSMDTLLGNDDSLVMRKLQDTECSTVSAAVWRKNSQLSRPAAEFIRYIRDMTK